MLRPQLLGLDLVKTPEMKNISIYSFTKDLGLEIK